MPKTDRRVGVTLILTAAIVGALTGIGAVVFRRLISICTELFTGRYSYGQLGRVPSTQWPWLSVWFLLLAPMVAGAIYGPTLAWCARQVRHDEATDPTCGNRPAVTARVAVIRALASAICIGAGGSVGRAGPIVQIGSTAAAALAARSPAGRSRMRLLMACGAAAGLAATYNAPLAGAFFGLELILRSFAADAFCATMTSAVIATAISRIFLGDHKPLRLPVFSVHSLYDYPLYALTGLLVGAVGVGFSGVLYRVEQTCDRVWRTRPEWARPVVGGGLLGALLLALPQLYGVGCPVLEAGVAGRYALGMLVALLLGKMLATSVTIGIGGCGGIFAPNLFIGAMAGTGFGTIVHHLIPAIAGSAACYGLIGMSAAFAGATRAPITAVMLVFEITDTYSIVAPLMVATILASSVATLRPHTALHAATLIRRTSHIDRIPTYATT